MAAKKNTTAKGSKKGKKLSGKKPALKLQNLRTLKTLRTLRSIQS